jgi:hypothetical protein
MGSLSVGGHSGLLLFWRAEPDALTALLPPPLTATNETQNVMCFLNVTQTGLNMWLEDDAADPEPLRRVHPLNANWHEAIFFVQCALAGEPVRYLVALYKDVDHGVLLGLQNGYHTKLATFHTRFPEADHELSSGTTLRMTASRFGNLVIDATFSASRQVEANAIPRPRTIGIRYFPDVVANEGPLIHDLVGRTMGRPDPTRPTSVVRAWVGAANVQLGDSELEGLAPLRPLQMLDGYYIDVGTLSGPSNTVVLHDYVRREM